MNGFAAQHLEYNQALNRIVPIHSATSLGKVSTHANCIG